MPGTKQANKRTIHTSPPLFTVESQPGGAGDRNVKKTTSFRGRTLRTHLAKCFCGNSRDQADELDVGRAL